jgi:hypothetical protein
MLAKGWIKQQTGGEVSHHAFRRSGIEGEPPKFRALICKLCSIAFDLRLRLDDAWGDRSNMRKWGIVALGATLSGCASQTGVVRSRVAAALRLNRGS